MPATHFAVWVDQATSLFENRKLLPKDSGLVQQVIGIGVVGSITGALLLILSTTYPGLTWLQLSYLSADHG